MTCQPSCDLDPYTYTPYSENTVSSDTCMANYRLLTPNVVNCWCRALKNRSISSDSVPVRSFGVANCTVIQTYWLATITIHHASDGNSTKLWQSLAWVFVVARKERLPVRTRSFFNLRTDVWVARYWPSVRLKRHSHIGARCNIYVLCIG